MAEPTPPITVRAMAERLRSAAERHAQMSTAVAAAARKLREGEEPSGPSSGQAGALSGSEG